MASPLNVAVIVPVKSQSRRYKNKNFRSLNGEKLYQILLKKLSDCDFDQVWVDTDSNEVKEFSLSCGYQTIDRQPELAADSANGNDLLNYHSTIVETDIYFQLFVTAPFLKTETINSAIDIMKNNLHYDSILTAEEIYSWFWFNGDPVNYEPSVLPRSQDAVPIVRESTGLYGIRSEALAKHSCRIGANPYFLYLDQIEAIDIDTELDFQIAELFHTD